MNKTLLSQALSPNADRYDIFSPTWIIYDKVNVEAGYVNDPRDSGGETNHGITFATSREWKSLWAKYNWNGDMRTLPEELAVEMYVKGWWEKMHLDVIHEFSPLIADKLFDFGINAGRGRAMLALQRWLTINNLNGKKYEDLTTDGLYGPATARALKAYIDWRGELGIKNLLASILCSQGEHYQGLAERRQKDEAFIYGWFTHRITADMQEYYSLIDSGKWF